MRVPAHLTHLRTDRRGLPVPYINVWGDVNDPARFRVGPDPYTEGKDAIWFDDADAGTPDFTHQNYQRQRRVVAESLCQVCARHVDGAERLRLLPVSSVLGRELVNVPGLGTRDVFTEPWLCQDCAMFAKKTCPALIRCRTNKDLRFVPVPAGTRFRVIASVGSVDPIPHTSWTRPVMWLKIALPATA